METTHQDILDDLYEMSADAAASWIKNLMDENERLRSRVRMFEQHYLEGEGSWMLPDNPKRKITIRRKR